MRMPMTDEELAEIKQAAKEAKASAKAANERADQVSGEHARLQQAYQNDMRIVGDKLFNQPAQAQQAAPVEDDGELTMDKVRAEIQQRVQMPAAQIGHNLVTQNRQLAAMTIPDFDRWAPEIDSLVARAIQASPSSVTNPSLYRDAFDVVRLQHQDEIIEFEAKRRTKARLVELGVEDEEEDGTVTAASGAESSSTPSTDERTERRAPMEPVVMTGSAGPRSSAPARRASPRLDDDQRYVAERLEMAPGDFDKYGSANYSPDIFGMKGRKKV
jgi:hypothetical protein